MHFWRPYGHAICHFGEHQRLGKCKEKSFWVTQDSVESTIYTSSKLVLGAFGFVHYPIMLLQDMNKDESLSTASYAFVI